MVNENLKPIELVQELKDEYKTPSYEEFMKDYGVDEKANDSYQGEFGSYGDLGVKGTYYGPGGWSDFWDDIKVVIKPVAKGALVVASVFPPTAPVAATITLGVAGTGLAAAGLGHVIDNKELKEFGKDIAEIGGSSHEIQGEIDHMKNSTSFKSR